MRLLDAGCGPGSWTLTAAAYARSKGLSVEAIGCDLSRAQLAIARGCLEKSTFPDGQERRSVSSSTI